MGEAPDKKLLIKQWFEKAGRRGSKTRNH